MMNIHERLAAVMRGVAYVKKDATVGTGTYAYTAVSHDQVTAATRPFFLEHGVLVRPSLVSSRTAEIGKTDKEPKLAIIRYSGTYDVAFINVDNPADRETIRVEADADDRGDKAPGKAMSYATKYAILKVLQLETGESDEARTVVGVGLSDDAVAMYLGMIAAAPTKESLEPVKLAAFKASKDALDADAHATFKTAIVKRLDDMKAPAQAATG
jgi:hypothetical protein